MNRMNYLCWALTLFLVPVVYAQNTGIEEQAAIGKTALDMKQYEQALEAFNLGLSLARERADTDAETRFIFYSGLAYQQAAENRSDSGYLRRAERAYSQVLRRKPDSGSTMVNLARVLAQLGRTDEASKLFQRAIRLDDDRQPAYMTAYAAFLESTGDHKGSRRFYLHLLQQDPFNLAAREALSNYYLDPSTAWPELKTYLGQLIKSGEIDLSINLALQALATRTSTEENEGLLSIVATGLSRKTGLAESFLESPAAASLLKFSGSASIGEGVRQLLGVYLALAAISDQRSTADISADTGIELSWWTRNDPDDALNPRDSMRKLLRALGGLYAQREKYAVAELCYQTAATFTQNDPDPAAIRDLVKLYAMKGEEQKIEQIADRFVFDLFKGKGDAYRNQELEKIYQYHRTLGQIYGHMAEKSGDWGSSDKVNSAIFQLEHALQVGRELDRKQANLPQRSDRYVDPGLVHRLATAYEATSSQKRGDDLRLTAAKRYQLAGDERAKNFVLKPVQVSRLDTSDKQEYQNLMNPAARSQLDTAIRPLENSSRQPKIDPSKLQRTDSRTIQRIDPTTAQRADSFTAQQITPSANLQMQAAPRLQVQQNSNQFASAELTQQGASQNSRIRVTSNSKMLTSKDREMVARYLDSLNKHKAVNPADQWLEMGGQGRLIGLNRDAGKMMLEISGKTVEIEFEPVP
jgi:predicted negative regulator of RcsB-dependent stress response